MNRMTKPFVILALVLAAGLSFAGEFTLQNYMNIQYAKNPSFHPNSNEFSYISNISGVPQAWRIAAFTGYQYQITFDTNGVENAWWSPVDQRLMVISASVGGNERSQLYITNPRGGYWYRITSNDKAIYSFGCWAPDGSRFAFTTNARNGTDFDLYEYVLADDKSTLLAEGQGMVSAAAYSPDNRYLLVEQTLSSFNGNLLLYDRAAGKVKLLTEHAGNIINKKPFWAPEGKGFYFLTDKDREFTGLAYWPMDSAAFRWVETPDRDIESAAISKDGTYLAWVVNESGFSKLSVRNNRKNSQTPPSRFPSGVILNLVFTNDGSKLAYTFGSGNRPYDIWVYETYADKLHQATFSATGGIPADVLIAPEQVEYPTFDGRMIPALWYKPQSTEGRLPVIVSIHGGPESQARPDMSSLFQYFLSRGYAILEPNIRGSVGYGKTYMGLDNGRSRMDAMQDIEYAARWLKSRSDVDPGKLVIMGGSYGGFAALSSLTAYPETWAAGVSIVGIANFVTFLENTGSYRRALREAEYGSLAADRDFLAQISPLTNVAKIKAPLMLIQGANDPRVPQSESDQMAEAIRKQGGIVDYLIFSDEGHGLAKTKNKIAAYTELDDFLAKHAAKKK